MSETSPAPDSPEPEPTSHHSNAQPDLRLSDSDRLLALNAIGEHYAAGRLDDAEFHQLSGDIAIARTVSALQAPFANLPDGPPLRVSDGRIVQSTATGVAPSGESNQLVPSSRSDEAELESLRKRGDLIESMSGVVIGVTLITFLILQFLVDWSYAWIVWPSLVLTLGLPRLILRYSDSDEELYEELKESEASARKKRLRAASERIQELNDGKDPDS